MHASSFKLLALSGLAALGALSGAVARAEDALAPEQTPAFASTLSRNDVQPGALDATRTATFAPLPAQETAPPMTQTADRNAVQADAIAALHADRIPYGEVGGAGE